MTFDDFQLDPDLLEGLGHMGFRSPTPIQEQAIPVILDNKDLIACAQTGTGKTAAYILPVLHKIMHAQHRHLNTLILAPTRELAQQIDQQIEGLAYFARVSSLPIYGGGSGAAWDKQKRALKEGADIIIATPGRLIAQLTSGDISFKHLEHLILDEADRMLDMGFFDDIIQIISYLPAKRQTLLFSATMPPKIKNLAGRILNNPMEITLAVSKPAEGILQQIYRVFDGQKIPLIKHIFQTGDYPSAIIFASTKEKVKQLGHDLHRIGLKVKAFHSDLEQEEREVILREFKNKQLHILVGTDILSRGIDVEGISLVVNFDAPPDPEDYIHRIGRTARAERTGTAITFINDKDLHKLRRIERLIGTAYTPTPLPEGLGAPPSDSQPRAEGSRQGERSGNDKGRSASKKKKSNNRRWRGGNKQNGGSEEKA